MSLLKHRIKAKNAKYQRRKSRVNAKIIASSPEYRLILNKSNLYISAQLLNSDAKVLLSTSDKGVKGDTKTNRAQGAGEVFADMLKKQKIEKVTIDRNGYSYQGRIKAFVDGLRAGGIDC